MQHDDQRDGIPLADHRQRLAAAPSDQFEAWREGIIMATMILFDHFTCFYLLLVALVFVVALCIRRGGPSPTGVDVRGAGRLPAQLYRIDDSLLQGLTGRNPGRRFGNHKRAGAALVTQAAPSGVVAAGTSIILAEAVRPPLGSVGREEN